MRPTSRAALAAVALVLGLAAVAATVSHTATPQLTASQAAQHVGERATVCGQVASTRYADWVRGRPTFLNLGRPYPRQLFTVVIWGEDRGNFDRPPEVTFENRRICVTGKIGSYRATPQIIVRRPKQIVVVDTRGQ